MRQLNGSQEARMVELDHLIPPLVNAYLNEEEKFYLKDIFTRHQGYPSLEQLWMLMDQQWNANGCDPMLIDHRVSSFYRHSVWLLNGLFIEQDPESLKYRNAFATWVKDKAPARVADFGGGFGSLARLIGAALPGTQVEVVEPHPHPAAIALAEQTPNVRYVPELSGVYDLMIATDVFEHVPDPIGLALSTASHLCVGGRYLIANCFAPVIKCHLPHLFHLQIGWDEAMRAMGLEPQEKVKYARAFERIDALNEQAARNIETLSYRLYPWLSILSKGRSRVGSVLVRLLSALPAH